MKPTFFALVSAAAVFVHSAQADLSEPKILEDEAITVRIIGTAKNERTVEVKAVAGPSPLLVRAYHWEGQTWKNRPKPIVKKLKANQTLTFTYKANPKYEVKAFRGNKLVDWESYKRKTGL